VALKVTSITMAVVVRVGNTIRCDGYTPGSALFLLDCLHGLLATSRRLEDPTTFHGNGPDASFQHKTTSM
jgi:hypothetical protein